MTVTKVALQAATYEGSVAPTTQFHSSEKMAKTRHMPGEIETESELKAVAPEQESTGDNKQRVTSTKRTFQ